MLKMSKCQKIKGLFVGLTILFLNRDVIAKLTKAFFFGSGFAQN